MKKMALYMGKRLLFLLCLNLVFLLLLTLCYLPPNAWIQGNAEASLAQLAAEGDYVQLGSYGDAAQMDNFTDRMWISNAVKQEAPNSFVSAVAMHGLSKFWNGYLVWLRPLLLFFSYLQIRFLWMLGTWFLLFWAAFRLGQRLGGGTAAAFVVSIGLCQPNAVTYTLGLSMDFVLMALAVIVLCRLAPDASEQRMGLIFVIMGAVYIFQDFLMAPLLTLLVPLVAAYSLRLGRYGGFWPRALFLARMGLWWALGFGFTWAFRWLVTLAVLGPVALNAQLESIGVRTSGAITERLWAVKLNWEAYFTRYAAVALGLVLAVWAVLLVRRVLRLRRKAPGAAGALRQLAAGLPARLPVLLLCAVPYLWVFILANHSIHHFWYTYRMQAGVLLAVLTVLFSMVEDGAKPGAPAAPPRAGGL